MSDPPNNNEPISLRRKVIGPIIGVAIFIVALTVLSHELAAVDTALVFSDLSARHWTICILALLTAIASYLAASGIDVLCFSSISKPPPTLKVLQAAFVGYAVSYNLGFSALTGPAVRYRMLHRYGIDGATLTAVLARLYVLFWLSTLLLFASALALEADRIAEPLDISSTTATAIAFALMGAIFTLIIVLLNIRRTFTFRGIRHQVPRAREIGTTLVLGVLDWGFAGLTLYLFLPDLQLNFLSFLGIFIVAQLTGIISHVPGGLGVFEAIMLIAVGDSSSTSHLAAGLMLFRITYYFIPLLIGSGIFLRAEWETISPQVRPVTSITTRLISSVTPTIVAGLAFISGIILLTSGATPANEARLFFLNTFVPLQVVEASHFIGSIVGIGLLVISRGLFLRLREAYFATIILLGAGIIASLVKGLDVEEALLLFSVITLVYLARGRFFRSGRLLDEGASPLTITLASAVVALTLWITFIAYRDVPYSHQLWWEFTFSGDASRSLRASFGALIVLVGLSLYRGFSIPSRNTQLPSSTELDEAARIINTQSNSSGWLALLGDKAILMSASSKSFLMYAIHRESLIVMGDPIGIVEEFQELIWKAREISERDGLSLCFYEIGPEHLPLYLDLGLTLFKLGEEARIALGDFSLEGRHRGSLRQGCARVVREGAQFEIIPAELVASYLPRLQEISDHWLSTKQVKEKRFSLGRFDAAYVLRTPIGIIRMPQRDGEPPANSIVAFVNIWPSENREEFSIDLMRYDAHAPKGVMDFLFVQTLLWGKSQGYRYFSLGMAPLSGLSAHPLAPLWHRIGTMIFRHGENLYNFRGLRNYKEKYNPAWIPRYLASRGGLALPGVLLNITSLISGGTTRIFRR